MNINIKRGIGIFLLGGVTTTALADTNSGNLILASNNDVLAAWQQSAGGGAEPELVKQDDGGTKIEWHGGVTLNGYVDTVSGGPLLTPKKSGSYYKADANSDLRVNSPDGSVSYAQFAMTGTNDHSVLSQHNTQINTLIIGHTGQGYDIRFGDTALTLSSLAGSTAGTRGIQAQKQFGPSTLVSVVTGIMAPSWEALGQMVPRTQYLRDVYAAKLEQGVGDTTRLFVTQEGYADRPSSLDSTTASLLAAASASVTTVGFNYQENSLNVTGEAGASRWSETGQSTHDSGAYVLDANWTKERYNLYGGYHDTGLYYSSLPGQAAPGVRETFVGGNWMATSWLALNMDLRLSENKLADTVTIPGFGTLTAVATSHTDAAAAGETFTFGQNIPGLSLAFKQSSSKIRNGDGTHGNTAEYGADATYTRQVWNAGVGYDFNKIDNPMSAMSSGKTETLNANFGVNKQVGVDETMQPEWMTNLSLSGSLQHYVPAAGSGHIDTRSAKYTIQMHAQRGQWLILDANYGESFMTMAGSASVRARTYDVSASHPFGVQSSFRFYLSNYGNIAGAANQLYSEKQVGVELIYQL